MFAGEKPAAPEVLQRCTVVRLDDCIFNRVLIYCFNLINSSN